MPINYLLVESIRKFHAYYGDDFLVECPTGSGMMLTLRQVADELSARLRRLFVRGDGGSRPSLGPDARFRDDPHFRDHLLFHEYFHGDDGRGFGASPPDRVDGPRSPAARRLGSRTLRLTPCCLEKATPTPPRSTP